MEQPHGRDIIRYDGIMLAIQRPTAAGHHMAILRQHSVRCSPVFCSHHSNNRTQSAQLIPNSTMKLTYAMSVSGSVLSFVKYERLVRFRAADVSVYELVLGPEFLGRLVWVSS